MIPLPHTNAMINEIVFDETFIVFMEGQCEEIVKRWVDYPAINDIRHRIMFTKEQFQNEIGMHVMRYLCTVLRGENKPGNCPTMRVVAAKFYEIGLTVEDVFLNCAAFKNVIIRTIDETNHRPYLEQKYNLVMLLDYNLYGVLSIYTEMMRAHELNLEIHNRIIEENVLMTRTDPSGIIVEVTDAFCDLCGYTKEELVGNTHAMLKDPDADECLYQNMWETILLGDVWTGEVRNRKKDGTVFITMLKIVPVWDKKNGITEYFGLRTDLTSDKLADLDPLTSLYNRRAFDKKSRKLFADATLNNEPLSIIIADIDHFKSINDMYGHDEGDRVITVFAEIILRNTRSNDLCVRWGGEEFLILLPGISSAKGTEIAERIRTVCENELRAEGKKVTCSFGVSEKRDDESVSEFLKRTDQKLYQAKHLGRNQTVGEENSSQAVEEFRLFEDFRF